MQALERAIKEDEAKTASPSGSGRSTPAIARSSGSDRKTAAEKRFEETQRKRVRASCYVIPRHLKVLGIPAGRKGGEVGKQDTQGSCQRVQCQA